jgi:hypothetical protein
MIFNFNPKKPHVIVPGEDDGPRAQKLIRNFNDIWGMFVEISAPISRINDRVNVLEGASEEVIPHQSGSIKPGWEDLRVPLLSTKLLGSKDPGLAVIKTNGAGSQGVIAYVFDQTTEEELYFAVQIPHSWKVGTPIRPHIHWCPTNTNTGTVSFGLEYTIANYLGVFGNTVILGTQQAGAGVAYTHQLAPWSEISMTGKTISCMLLCRVFRDATGSLGPDTYNTDAALLEVDFHYKANDLGSRAEYVK